jgi:hypothetical protein
LSRQRAAPGDERRPGRRAVDRRALERELDTLRARLNLRGDRARWMGQATASVVELLAATPGTTLQQRWTAIEHDWWSRWEAGQQRLAPERQLTWGPAALVLSRSVRPGWTLLSRGRLSQWPDWLPVDDRLNRELRWLRERIGDVAWAGDEVRRRGQLLGIRILLFRGYVSSAGSPPLISPRFPGASRAAWMRWTRCSARRACRRAARSAARSAGFGGHA